VRDQQFRDYNMKGKKGGGISKWSWKYRHMSDRRGDKVLTENTIKNSDNGLKINTMESLYAISSPRELTESFLYRFKSSKYEATWLFQQFILRLNFVRTPLINFWFSL
jgi:hypothetical protein